MTDNEDEKVLRKTLASLDVQRKAMEHEADAIISELMTPPEEGVEPMGLDTPLVDQDGYPRGDIDVYRARSQRSRFRILKTDHKEIEGKIEALLLQLASMKNPSKQKAEAEERAQRLAPKPKPKYDAVTGKWVVMNWDGSVSGVKDGESLSFQNLSKNRNSSESGNMVAVDTNLVSAHERNDDSSRVATSRPQKRPFAKVNAIASGSPAEDSGMNVGDLITRFGPLDIDNNNQLRALATLVPEVAAEGGIIQIVVLRFRSTDVEQSDLDEKNYHDESMWKVHILKLRPKPFSGRGLLGCHILPL